MTRAKMISVTGHTGGSGLTHAAVLLVCGLARHQRTLFVDCGTHYDAASHLGVDGETDFSAAEKPGGREMEAVIGRAVRTVSSDRLRYLALDGKLREDGGQDSWNLDTLRDAATAAGFFYVVVEVPEARKDLFPGLAAKADLTLVIVSHGNGARQIDRTFAKFLTGRARGRTAIVINRARHASADTEALKDMEARHSAHSVCPVTIPHDHHATRVESMGQPLFASGGQKISYRAGNELSRWVRERLGNWRDGGSRRGGERNRSHRASEPPAAAARTRKTDSGQRRRRNDARTSAQRASGRGRNGEEYEIITTETTTVTKKVRGRNSK